MGSFVEMYLTKYFNFWLFALALGKIDIQNELMRASSFDDVDVGYIIIPNNSDRKKPIYFEAISDFAGKSILCRYMNLL